jgi:hypothetical protein
MHSDVTRDTKAYVRCLSVLCMEVEISGKPRFSLASVDSSTINARRLSDEHIVVLLLCEGSSLSTPSVTVSGVYLVSKDLLSRKDRLYRVSLVIILQVRTTAWLQGICRDIGTDKRHPRFECFGLETSSSKDIERGSF